MQFNTTQTLRAIAQETNFRSRVIALLCGAATLLLAGWATADPPARVARLSYISGAVSFSPAGEDDWVEAGINRPLITGDRLWVDSGSRAELQIGSAVLHLGSGTSMTLLNLDNRVAQLEVTQGTVNAQVRRLGARDVIEIDTPNLAYSIRKPGGYRVDVDAARDTTNVYTRKGQGEVYGDGASYLVNAGQTYRFYGTDVRDYDYLEPSRADEFDRWSDGRNRRADNAVSARYVSRDLIGYEDLDEHGSWRRDANYGNVWVPNRVAADWAPYRDGHWSWVEPWGWTWVDDAPWGFAVSHYGRWANMNGTWGWVPGPTRAQPVYAPALVAFIGGATGGAAISNSNVGWFPLGPRDVYWPSYPVSRGYFDNVNRSNTTINNTTITNVYNTKVTNITYVNQRVPGAVVAVPADSFRRSHSVAKSRVEMPREVAANAQVTPVAAVAPERASVHGGRDRGRKPPEQAQARPVVAKERPPAVRPSFAARERGLEANPGRPLDAAALSALKPAAAAPAAAVKVVAPPAQPAAAPPPKPAVAQAAPQTDERRGRQRPDGEKGMRQREDDKGRRADDRKGAPPEAEKSRPPEVQKGVPSPDGQKGRSADEKKDARPPEAEKGRPAEVMKGTPPVDGEKGRQSDMKKGLPEAEKGRPAEVQKAQQPPDAEKGRRADDRKGAPTPEAEKGGTPDAERGRRSGDRKAEQSPDGQKGPPFDRRRGAPDEKGTPPASVPRPPEPPKAPPPPEPPKAPPPAVKPPPEPPKAPPPEERKAPPPPVQRPPEPPKAPPPPVQRPPEPPKSPAPPVPRPPDPPKAPPPPANVPKPPDAQKPPLTDAQKADAAKADAAKAEKKRREDRRRDKKDDDEENRRK